MQLFQKFLAGSDMKKKSIIEISKGIKNLSNQISSKNLIDACKTNTKLNLGNLVQQISPRFNDVSDLILPAKQIIQFNEVINSMKSLTDVHYNLRMAKVRNESGIIVLFSGPSGSGKTMAAEIISAKLNLPIYRIDMSQVVSKYIGETSKNLKNIFDAVEIFDVILFFDEADSIFGHRTEVKDSNDVHVNQIISYLLTRIEHFKGLAILATNRKKDLDEAFTRRINYSIEFPFPGEKERKILWKQMLPCSLNTNNIDIDFLAKNFPLTGGNIHSIIFNSCLQCFSNVNNKQILPKEQSAKYQLTMEQVIISVRREYEKIGRDISLDKFTPYDKILKNIGYH